MEPLFEVHLRHATDTQLTLATTDDPSFLSVSTMTPGRILQAYHAVVTKYRERLRETPNAPAIPETYEVYEILVRGLAGPGYTIGLRNRVLRTFSLIKVYLEWNEVQTARVGYMGGAEIYFCAPDLGDSWFFKDAIETVDVKFT